jgi:hypothetical protein
MIQNATTITAKSTSIFGEAQLMLERQAERDDRADDDERRRHGAEGHQRLADNMPEDVASARPHRCPRERTCDRDPGVSPELHASRPRHARGDGVQLGKESAAEQKGKLMTAKASFSAVDMLG